MHSRRVVTLLLAFVAGVLFQCFNSPGDAFASSSRTQPYAFSNIYKVKFSAHGTQTLGMATSYLVANTEDYDIGSGYDAANSKFFAPVAGRYIFIANCYVGSGSTLTNGATGGMYLYKNGAITNKNYAVTMPTGVVGVYLMNFQLTWALDLAANDEVKLSVGPYVVGQLNGATAETTFQGFRLVE